VFWTGDNSPHNIWKNDIEEVYSSMVRVTEMVKETFLDTDTAVYPCLGNHDFWPSNNQNFDIPEGENQLILKYGLLWKDFIG
jgi:hypothetical protein